MNHGVYENFPAQIHRVESFISILSIKHLQQTAIQVFHKINQREFSFEEAANPTIPGCKVFFDIGLAEAQVFNYIDEEELKKAIDLLAKEHLHSIDFFCAIRYYKGNAEIKQALKFDYYILRTIYNSRIFEIQVFHEKGPRYISPEDLTFFIFNQINEFTNKKILKRSIPQL